MLTGNVLCFLLTIISLARLIFLLFLAIRNYFMCCLSFRSNEYFFFYREPKKMSRNDAKFRDRA